MLLLLRRPFLRRRRRRHTRAACPLHATTRHFHRRGRRLTPHLRSLGTREMIAAALLLLIIRGAITLIRGTTTPVIGAGSAAATAATSATRNGARRLPRTTGAIMKGRGLVLLEEVIGTTTRGTTPGDGIELCAR